MNEFDDYEYDSDEHNSESNDLYGMEVISKGKKPRPLDQGDQWGDMKTRWQKSDVTYSSRQMDQILQNLPTYNQLFFKSWSSLFIQQTDGSGGSIFRLQNSNTRKRTNDYDLSFRLKGSSENFKENMNYLKDEVMADIAMLDTYKVGGVSIYTASSKKEEDGCIQILLIKVGNSYSGYISLCDQLFIHAKNKFYLNEKADKPSLDWQQSFDIKQLMTIEEAVQFQRKIKIK